MGFALAVLNEIEADSEKNRRGAVQDGI